MAAWLPAAAAPYVALLLYCAFLAVVPLAIGRFTQNPQAFTLHPTLHPNLKPQSPIPKSQILNMHTKMPRAGDSWLVALAQHVASIPSLLHWRRQVRV